MALLAGRYLLTRLVVDLRVVVDLRFAVVLLAGRGLIYLVQMCSHQVLVLAVMAVLIVAVRPLVRPLDVSLLHGGLEVKVVNSFTERENNV